MTNRKTTRRALVLSLLSLLLCCSMLVGTTFAWFTDAVTSGKNQIIAGNLDIELDYSMDLVNWKDDITAVGDIFVAPEGAKKGLWEPGHTEVAYLRITNAGSLSLKYQLRVNPFNEVTGTSVEGNEIVLSNILKFAATEPSENALTKYTRESAQAAALAGNGTKLTQYTTEVVTMAPGDVQYVALVVYMPEEVGNEANYLTGTTAPSIEFALDLRATQVEAEKDSFDENYDKDTVVSTVVSTIEELNAAIADAKDGDVIALADDLTVEETDAVNGNALYYNGDKSFTIDLNGSTLTANTSNAGLRFQKASGGKENKITIKNGTIIASDNTWSAVSIGSDAETKTYVDLIDLKISSSKPNDLAVRSRKGAVFTITDCEITATNGAGAVVAGGGNVTLNNVTVKQSGVYVNNWNAVALGISGGATMTVNSGSYTSDPEGNSKGSWVAYIMSSGGNLNINGGTFNGTVAETANAANACGIISADTGAVVNIKGGTFNSNGAILDMRNNTGNAARNPKATLSGGTFSSDPRVSGLYSSNLIKVAEGYITTQNADGSWKVAYDGAEVINADELAAALASGEKILLKNDIEYQSSIVLAEGASLDGNGKTITYTGTEYTYHLVKLNTGATVENVTLENYRVRTESTTNGTVTLKNVTINMDNDETGLDISRGAGTAKLTNVTCKGTKDVAHLDPNTQVQVAYTPYGDVLLGTKWGLEATDCAFGSLHGWNTTNGSNVTLNNTTYTVFRMHYWSNRTLYIDDVETAWSESGAIPVAHDVGGCWSVQPAFK